MANLPPTYSAVEVDDLCLELKQRFDTPGVTVVALPSERTNPFARLVTDAPQRFVAGVRFRVTVREESRKRQGGPIKWLTIYVDHIRRVDSRNLLWANLDNVIARGADGRKFTVDQRRRVAFIELLLLCEERGALGDVLADDGDRGCVPEPAQILGVLLDRGLLTLKDVRQAQATLGAMDSDNPDEVPEYLAFNRRHGLRP